MKAARFLRLFRQQTRRTRKEAKKLFFRPARRIALTSWNVLCSRSGGARMKPARSRDMLAARAFPGLKTPDCKPHRNYDHDNQGQVFKGALVLGRGRGIGRSGPYVTDCG